jgi:hypothetical protein
MPRNTFDPRLELPPVVGVEYDENYIGTDAVGIPSDEPIVITPLPDGLLPPESITVLEQIIRQGAGGKEVVDLVIDVQDMAGATEYEVRVSS